MKIVLVIYPSVEPITTKLKHVPQVGHHVFYKGKLYDVTGVSHNIDVGVIKVMLIDN